jgi:endo-1,4-beta-xylanase
MRLSLSIASLLPFILSVIARPQAATSAASPASTASGTPNAVAKAAGKLYFGTATDTPEFSDAPYQAILGDTTTFGQLTAANSMKWVSNPIRY